MKVLIDFDILVYQCGFASDSGAKKEGLEHEPLEYCLSSVKKTIQNIVHNTQANEYVGFLTGEGNYREDIAVTKPYKGNREEAPKPYWYKEIKKYLIEKHNAEIVVGKEADDQMGIEQVEQLAWNGNVENEPLWPEECGTVIASLDKDMNMIPGWHYNWRKDLLYWVDEETASQWFYCQLVMGDPTDNIQGLPKKGKKAAYNILKDCETEYEMYIAVLEEYNKAYEDGETVMKEMANLLFIQREEDTLWTPPK